jgi:hypothetical protein
MSVKLIECTQGHYEAYEVEFGMVYKWCPECVVVECDCGERPTLTWSTTTCDGCGANHAGAVRKELHTRGLVEEDAHPWRYAVEHKDAGLPY